MGSPEPISQFILHMAIWSAYLIGPIIGVVLGAYIFRAIFKKWLPELPSTAWNDK
ncbi:MAG: hypothetical protein V3V84_09185 [Candidatus Bathyarchaeia archaeon]